MHMVTRFLIRGLIFILPFGIYFAIIYTIDPFNYAGDNKVISDTVKQQYSGKINYALWELNAFRKRPSPYILLGDSRMLLVDTKILNRIKQQEFINLAYGGGNLNEAINTFWFVSKTCALKEVYMGINIEMYNQNNNRDRVNGVVMMFKNPLLYFTNPDVIEAGYYCFKNRNNSKGSSFEAPPMTAEEFWKFQLTETAGRYYSNYLYPQTYFNQLQDIVHYCKQNNVQIHFIIFPTHTDLQDQIDAYHLQKENERFVNDLRILGEVYNLNLRNTYTRNRENFRDPFHFKSELFNEIYAPVLFAGKEISDSIATVSHHYQ